MSSMSNPFPSETPFQDQLSQAYSLLSRELDETLNVAESDELRRLEGAYPQEILAFRTACLQLRETLGSLPVKPVGKSLFVASAVPAATVPGPVERSPAAERRTRSGAQRLILGMVTSVLCGVLVLALNRSQHDHSSEPMMADFSGAASAEQLALDRHLSMDVGNEISASGIPAVEMPELSESSKARAMAPAAGIASPAKMASRVRADDRTLVESDLENSADHSSIDPLIQSDNWHVVVVKVDGQDRDMAMDRIHAIVQEHGLRLQKSAGHDQSDWLGVVLTSAMARSSEVLTAMERDLGEPTPAAAESKLDTSRHAEIIAAVRESLRYPTRSELHSGRIFVALPTLQDAKLVAGAKSDSASNRPGNAASVPADPKPAAITDAADALPVQPEAVVAKRAARNQIAAVAEAHSASAVVTLVVFEFH